MPEIPKISPYRQLQNIFNEGEEPQLTQRGKDVLDELLGKDPEPVPSFWDKIVNFFKSIDSKLFPKASKMGDGRYHRRK